MTDVEVGVLLPPSLRGRQNGRVFLEPHRRHLPGHQPEKFDDHEPVRRPFSYEQLDDVLPYWKTGFLWTRKRPRTRGHVLLGDSERAIHDCVFLSFSRKEFDADAVVAFVAGIAAQWPVDLGYIQLTSPADLEDRAHYVNHVAPYSQGLTTHEIRKCLPSVCWGMFFGKPYIDLFGRERILSTPVHEVRELHPELIFLRLTASVGDCLKASQVVRAKTGEVVADLDSGAFCGMPGLEGYRAPAFVFT